MRYKKTKKILLFWCLLVGIGALYGSICMFIDPTGELLKMDTMLPYFNVLPFSDILFQNYIFSGISLLIVNGISNLIASYLIIKDKKLGFILGTIFGITLMMWITIQFIILPTNFLSISYFIIGFLQFIIGLITIIFYTQSRFSLDISKYNNVGKNNDCVVVYFSRMGYTKKIAYEEANEIGANIVELKTKEKTQGTHGFWWCGRFGMHKWRMNIENIDVDIKKFKKVYIVSPIWVFNISSPVRDFLYKYKDQIKKHEYIFSHFMKCNFKYVANQMDHILGNKRDCLTSYCVRYGKFVGEKYEETSRNI